eukprot:TRINITY_DN893_c0_g1::TRINITY_DN893_c0_g1_i1::g.25447::m.25447 TRINITY_DN893_c0_g1::TRINITY_DN893_c0_g1_i1::g.25447  ORF type:complete len:119 (+),score=39.21,sp/Q9SIK2/RS252_ARATH/77.50/6e-33,Ribosomal_S25/PF03297.10/6.4e-46,HTH_24/PF13412.1/2.1e+03,HTH_24/PF13412.1/0.00061,MarR_2/PF12802.2/0.0031,Fe_dep_repress/PF01325.14/0.0066,PCI/PF01399.22/0.012,Rrf2/PF02082.15/9.7e+02,Rrf2/PF02082.15/0.042,TrmB/PF01978.14/5.4e+03,TrmB/PF01978.14/0.027,RPA_C/PF08784.6/0.025,GntR/PF00392.16/0.11 TRINITY_DN89
MAKTEQKSKDAKAKAAQSGGKNKKKKWSKGKVKEKVNNLVLFDQATYDKLYQEVPKYKTITPSVLSERLRINGSLARKAIRELSAKGLIKAVSNHSSQLIYTKA